MELFPHPRHLYFAKVTGELALGIDVGGGPSGPSIEGPFCRAVYLCCALSDRKKTKEKRQKKKDRTKRSTTRSLHNFLVIISSFGGLERMSTILASNPDDRIARTYLKTKWKFLLTDSLFEEEII